MRSGEEAHDLLARFPGPVTLAPSRRKWIMVALAGAAFTAIGAWMVASGNAVGWLALVVFGPCTVIGLAAALPGAGGLTLRGDGFEIINLFRRTPFRWQDVDGFGSARVPPSGHNLVVFDHAPARGRTLAKLNAGLVGRNAGLPDTYGFSAEALAYVMANWRAKALAVAPPPGA